MWTITEPCLNREFPRVKLKNFHTRKIFESLHGLILWKVMPRNVWSDIVSWQKKTTQQLYKVSTPCIDDHHFKEEEMKSVGELSQVHALKLFWNGYIWHVLDDLIFYVQWTQFARSITKWTKACDKRLNRLISDIHHTCEYKQYCYVGNTAKAMQAGTVSRLPISWMCKKQTSVSHSSTETEIISLNAGLRLDGIPALDLWDLSVLALGNTTKNACTGWVVLRGDIVENDSGSYDVFTEQGSSASQMTVAKVMEVIERLPSCDGQPVDAVLAYTQVRLEDAPKFGKKIPKSECPDVWIRRPGHKWPKSWALKIPWYLSNEI